MRESNHAPFWWFVVIVVFQPDESLRRNVDPLKCNDKAKKIIMDKLREKLVDWYALRFPEGVDSIKRVDVFSYPLEEGKKALVRSRDWLCDDVCKTRWEAYECPVSDASP